MVNIKTIEYDVELVTETGAKYPLNGVLLSLVWSENINELAQRAVITLANRAMGDTWLMAIAKINCVILIYAKWEGQSRQLVFEGTVWEWQYVSSQNKEITLTAYDRLIRLQQSRDFFYYQAGMTTQALIADICNVWGVPFLYDWKSSLTHEKKIFNAEYLSDMIVGLLEEVRQKTGEKYIIYYKNSQMQITGYGTNAAIYRFDITNTTRTLNKHNISNLVTVVKILGKEDNEGRIQVESIVEGDTRYGVLQEIIRRDSNKTLEAALSEANALIAERGKPDEFSQADVPDIPTVRKGDIVEIAAGNLLGGFFVEGVEHNATARKMKLTLSRA